MKRISFLIIGMIVIMGGIYMFFGLLKIDKSKPRIIKLETPIKMIGVSMKTSMKTIYKDAGSLGKEYKKIKNMIPYKKEPWAFVAISKNFSSDHNSWEYLMGDVVTDFHTIPKDLVAFEIPVKTYAVFTIHPKFSFLWGPAIGLTKKYIFTEWLPNSKYDPDDDILGDFEYHDERSVARKPSIELYITVNEK